MFSINPTRKYYRTNNKRRQKAVTKRRTNTLGKAILAAWKDFCTTSSFVGFRYVYGKERTIIDAIFWCLLMPVLLYCSIAFVAIFLDRYHSMSTTTVVASQHHSSSLTNFPAVTACLDKHISKTKLNTFIVEYLNSNDGQKENFTLTDFVEIFDVAKIPDSNTLTIADRLLSAYNMTLRDMIVQTTSGCDEVLSICRFAGKITPCSRIFKPIIAVGGLCCTFNYPISEENLLKRKFLRTTTFGLHGGLSFAFKTFPNEDYYQKQVQGDTLRVLLHSSRTFPANNGLNSFFIPTSMESALEVNAVMNLADNKVRNLPVEYRDCIFGSEKSLRSFTRYSHANCLLQCKIDRVVRNCGCVSYFYPSDESEICPTFQLPCSLQSRFVEAMQGDEKVFSDYGDCDDCPDDCSIIKHFANLYSWNFTLSNHSVDDFYSKLTNDQGIVHIFYGKSTVTHLQRKIAFDEIELASDIGGIVAVFMGCSFVSVIEIIYFLTIRTLKFYN